MIFKPELLQAILDGKKTQTRRPAHEGEVADSVVLDHPCATIVIKPKGMNNRGYFDISSAPYLRCVAHEIVCHCPQVPAKV